MKLSFFVLLLRTIILPHQVILALRSFPDSKLRFPSGSSTTSYRKSGHGRRRNKQRAVVTSPIQQRMSQQQKLQQTEQDEVSRTYSLEDEENDIVASPMIEIDRRIIPSETELSVTTSIDKNHDETTVSSKSILLTVSLSSLTFVTIAAKVGWLPFHFILSSSNLVDMTYSNAWIARDIGCTVLGAILGYAYVQFITTLCLQGYLEPRDSRKIIHTLTAPLFILIWPLFSPLGNVYAACVPLVNAVRLYLASKGRESSLVGAVSRSGERSEALGGPMVYVLILFAVIVLFWRDNMIGVTALCIMAAGDGMADIIGRRYGKGNAWFFSPKKSVAGSVAFLLFGSVCTVGLATYLSATGCLILPFDIPELIIRVVAITAICAIVELIPFGDDNWSVPISAAILATFFLQEGITI
jgi:phytol kinase